ncbi:MAG: DMT family transporter, partial [Turicibacter sp.]
IKGNQLIGIACMMIGISVLSLERDFSVNIGDVLTLIGAFGFGGQIIATGYFANKCNSYCFNTVQMGVAGLLGMMCAVSFESLPPFTPQGVLAVLYLGILSTLVAFLLQAIAQKYTSETKVGLILSTEAVFGAVLSVLILHDPVTWRLCLGGAIVFASIIIIEVNPFKTNVKEESDLDIDVPSPNLSEIVPQFEVEKNES